MYYIIQENLFREEGHAKLLTALDRLGLGYEMVRVLPFVEDVEFETDRTDGVFVFGSLKLARLSKKYGWYPGAMVTHNHDYEVYSQYYGNHLLNHDSRVTRFDDTDAWPRDHMFVRPCLDTKTFTGKVFSRNEWDEFTRRMLDHPDDTQLRPDTRIQVAIPKQITQEVRCWVVSGRVVTQSTYRRGSFLVYDNLVDQDAIDFAQRMVDKFSLADTFVIDVCLTDSGWKIVECGSTSCAGFYDADMQRLIIALESMKVDI